MTERTDDGGSGALLDPRHQEALRALDLEETVRGLGIDPAKVVVLDGWPADDDLPELAELRDGPLGRLLQAAAATAVSMGAAAQRESDQVRSAAAADAERVAREARERAVEEAERLHRQALQEAEELQREAYREARRIRAEARRRAAAQEMGARLHATVEARPLRGTSSLEVTRYGRVVLRSERKRSSASLDPLLDPRVASQIRALKKGRRADGKRARTAVATVGALALVLGSAATMAVTGTTPREAGGTVLAVGREALDLGDPDQLRRVLPIEQLAARLGEGPDRAGSSGIALVGALRQVHELTEAERRNRALGLANDIERAVRDGRLTPETERAVRPVLLQEATPPDVAGLIDVLRVRALGAGPDGPLVLELLQGIGTEPRPAQRAFLMRLVRRSADAGRLSSAFRVVAANVLEAPPAPKPVPS